MKIAFVTGIVTPYTDRLFNRLGEALPGGLHVFACSGSEPGRHWELAPATAYQRRTMRGLRVHRSYVSHLYLNPGIVPAILAGSFDVVLVSDFSPTMMLALAAARLAATPVIVSTDGQPETDPGQHSAIHRLARRLVVPASRLGIGASRGSLDLLERHRLSTSGPST
jgi:hypothetical protein